MRRVLLGVVSITLLCPLKAENQEWTAEERAVLDAMRVCWNAWKEATAQKDFDVWLSKCHPADDYSMWWTNFGTPAGADFDRRTFDFISHLEEEWIAFHPAEAQKEVWAIPERAPPA